MIGSVAGGRKSRAATIATTFLFLLLLTNRAVHGAADSEPNSILEKSSPENPDDLRAIERYAMDVARKAIGATVAVNVGRAVASGVIVTEDGYVLTAAHVTGRPGREVRITFSDGATAEATSLGLNSDVDAALVKLNGGGPWPYLPLVDSDQLPRPGSWCVATGHPGGLQPGRPPVIRLGRVIEANRLALRTDCTITVGDSGGPLLNMQGQVIGIHSRITEDSTMNLHVPAGSYVEDWERLAAGEILPSGGTSRFLDHFDTDRDGKVSRDEVPEGIYRRVYDRLMSRFDLDRDKTHTMEELNEAFGWQGVPRNGGFDPSIPFVPSGRRGWGGSDGHLSPRRFAQGRDVQSAFGNAISDVLESTVQVRCGGEVVAFGCVVGAEGWVLTKATQLNTDQPSCRLQDGRVLPARRVSVHPEYDLAILQIEASGLKTISWSDPASLSAGRWVVSPESGGRIAGVGVVSVSEREIPGSPPVLGVQVDDRDEGAFIAWVSPESGAARAGIQKNDLVTHVMGEPVRNLQQLRGAVQKHHVGDRIKVSVTRGELGLELTVTLGMIPDAIGLGNNPFDGELSIRRDSFPSAFQHDSVIEPNQCGGPVLNVDGKVIGMNIARVDRTATLALPSGVIRSFLKQIGLVDRDADGGDA